MTSGVFCIAEVLLLKLNSDVIPSLQSPPPPTTPHVSYNVGVIWKSSRTKHWYQLIFPSSVLQLPQCDWRCEMAEFGPALRGRVFRDISYHS